MIHDWERTEYKQLVTDVGFILDRWQWYFTIVGKNVWNCTDRNLEQKITQYMKNEHTNSINHEMHHRIYAVAWLFMIIDQTFHAMIMVIIYEILVFMDNIFHTYSVHDPYSKSIQSMFCTYRGKILARWSAWKIADAPARFPNYDFYHKMSQNKRNWSIVSFSNCELDCNP